MIDGVDTHHGIEALILERQRDAAVENAERRPDGDTWPMRANTAASRSVPMYLRNDPANPRNMSPAEGLEGPVNYQAKQIAGGASSGGRRAEIGGRVALGKDQNVECAE
jgi:hypothetical protein